MGCFISKLNPSLSYDKIVSILSTLHKQRTDSCKEIINFEIPPLAGQRKLLKYYCTYQRNNLLKDTVITQN